MSPPRLNWGRTADDDSRACYVKLADGGTLIIDDYDNGEVILLLESADGEQRAIYQCGRPEPGWWGRLWDKLRGV